MSSVYLSSDEMTMLDRLLAEVTPKGADRASAVTTMQARLLLSAFEDGMVEEASLRRFLANQLTLIQNAALSLGRWEREGLASPHREEHQLPSPEEEFNRAASINGMASAPHGSAVLIARNTGGETARVRRVSTGDADHENHTPRWVRTDTNDHFAPVHWVESTWTADDVHAHLRETQNGDPDAQSQI